MTPLLELEELKLDGQILLRVLTKIVDQFDTFGGKLVYV
jgi:hypothetical protein